MISPAQICRFMFGIQRTGWSAIRFFPNVVWISLHYSFLLIIPAIVKKICKIRKQSNLRSKRRSQNRKNKIAESVERLIPTHFCGLPLYQFPCCDVSVYLYFPNIYLKFLSLNNAPNSCLGALYQIVVRKPDYFPYPLLLSFVPLLHDRFCRNGADGCSCRNIFSHNCPCGYDRPVSDMNASLILKLTAGINKHMRRVRKAAPDSRNKRL